MLYKCSTLLVHVTNEPYCKVLPISLMATIKQIMQMVQRKRSDFVGVVTVVGRSWEELESPVSFD